MTELEKYIQTYFGVTNDELTKISSLFTLVPLKKGMQNWQDETFTIDSTNFTKNC